MPEINYGNLKGDALLAAVATEMNSLAKAVDRHIALTDEECKRNQTEHVRLLDENIRQWKAIESTQKLIPVCNKNGCNSNGSKPESGEPKEQNGTGVSLKINLSSKFLKWLIPIILLACGISTGIGVTYGT